MKNSRTLFLISRFFLCGFLLSACSAFHRPSEATLNEKLLKEQRAKKDQADSEALLAPTGDLSQSSLWAKSMGSPYLIRNQKAQKVGDLLTVMINENTNATTTADTNATRDGKLTLTGSLGLGQGDNPQIGGINGLSENKNEFTGQGSTDRSNRFTAVVQATVENVLPNGSLFVRGRKAMTINREDQEVEISGFVRPDDILINNTVFSNKLADAEIRYVGQGVISDKQGQGWGARILDWIWPW